MNITIENYESWMLDYLEGRLSADDISRVEAFLLLHPEIRDEMDEAGRISLSSDAIVFEDKHLLYKSPHRSYGISEDDYLAIGLIEGDLSAEERILAEARMKQGEPFNENLRRLSMTRLVPDAAIQYPHKKQLLKHRRMVPVWVYPLMAAAALTGLVWILWPVFMNQDAGQVPGGSVLPRDVATPLRETPQTPPPRTAGEDLIVETPAHIEYAAAFIEADTDGETILAEPLDFQPAMIASMKPSPIHGGLSLPMYLARSEQEIVVYSSSDYASIPEVMLKLFRIRILDEDPEQVKKTRFSLWEVADAGLERFNDFAGTNMDLSREYNDSGDLEKVSFNSRLIGFSTPLKKVD